MKNLLSSTPCRRNIALLLAGAASLAVAARPAIMPPPIDPVASDALAKLANSFKLVPIDQIVRADPPMGAGSALTNPKTLAAADAAKLTDDDVVVGVEFGGAARAYPIRIMNWHHLVNDELGGRSIAVTYCPLTGSAVVMDRMIDGKPRNFGVSNLLYHSNMLISDAQGGAGSDSLWIQMTAMAVVGPAAKASQSLEILPAQMTTWSAWKQTHPGTTTLDVEPGRQFEYDSNPYAKALEAPEPASPVANPSHDAPDTESIRAKEPAIIVLNGERTKIYPASRLKVALAKGAASISDSFGVREFAFKAVDAERGLFDVSSPDGKGVPVVFAFWFEARAAYPNAEVFDPTQPPPVAVETTVATFSATVLESKKPVLVDFWATWCGPCLELSRTVEQMARERRDVISVARVDVVAQPDLSLEYEADQLPLLVLFRDGKEVARHLGILDREELDQFLADNGIAP